MIFTSNPHLRGLATYETATTRQFYHGRTETVRSCTPEAMEFAKALSEGGDDESLRKALEKAVRKHVDLMERCKQGLGCDRLLFGLKVTAMEKELAMPDLLQDSNYKIR